MGNLPSSELRSSDVSDLLSSEAPQSFLNEVHNLATAVSNGKSRTYDDAIIKSLEDLQLNMHSLENFHSFVERVLVFMIMMFPL